MSETPACPSLSFRQQIPFRQFWGSLMRAHPHLLSHPGPSYAGQWPQVCFRLGSPSHSLSHMPIPPGPMGTPHPGAISSSLPLAGPPQACLCLAVLREYLLRGATSAPVDLSPGVVFQGIYPRRKQCKHLVFSPGPTCVLGSGSLIGCTKSDSLCLCTLSPFVHSTPTLKNSFTGV